MTSNVYNLISVLICLGAAILCLSIVFHEYEFSISGDDDE